MQQLRIFFPFARSLKLAALGTTFNVFRYDAVIGRIPYAALGAQITHPSLIFDFFLEKGLVEKLLRYLFMLIFFAPQG